MTESAELFWRFEAASGRASLTDEDRSALDDELDGILKLIASRATFNAAEPLLEELGRVQEVMATLAFKYSAHLSERQREIVRDYDRCDIDDVRRRTFEKIKNAEFPWCCVRE